MATNGDAVSVPAPTREPDPPVISAPAPQEDVVTTVKEQVTVKKSAPKPVPAPVPEPETRPRQSKGSKTSTKTSTTKSSSTVKGSRVKSSSGYPSYYSDLQKEFHGVTPSVLDNIGSHPLLFSRAYEPSRYPGLSARSRKFIREAADLACVSPGLKNLLEVMYCFKCFYTTFSSFFHHAHLLHA